ncbi:MAG: N-6 DNA methylase [Spirochaetales bacterium]|nr:N-6 DNA methylase [Spirochaetales bacterium]
MDSTTRRREGIFFTGPSVVEEICSSFDFSSVRSVIDTAAGSCNFLLPLAMKYPEIDFYGIERNEKIYRSVLPALKKLPNLHYFHGDALLDQFPIPPCDLYLGNPPFINYTDLSESYREAIRPLWTQYMPVKKSFALLLGESRGDVASLVFYHSLNRYLKKEGRFGVVLPNSLIKGNRASESFREFPGITVEKVVDISRADAFVNTNRACFYLLGHRGGETKYPLAYERDGETVSLIKKNGLLIEEDLPLGDGSDYPIRQGINTLGANGVFFFHEKPDLEEGLLHPLLRSCDVGENRAEPSRWVLLPYGKKGELIDEVDLKRDYPRAWNYLLSHKKRLEKRKSRFAQKNWYALFGIGSYTFAPWKVVWRAMGAKSLEAAVITDAIPNQAMHGYIACQSREEANYLCARLNSPEIRRMAALLSESRSRSFAQPGTMKLLPLKKYEG